MRAATLFVLFVLSLVAGALAFLLVNFYIPRESPGAGRGMGPQFYALIPIFVVPATFFVGLLAYMALFPEIRETPKTETSLPKEQESISAVLRVLREDERKVVELLMSAGGMMLQSDIARKTGFSRVKTHRILYRLSTRGIVTAKKYYNTYQISLAEWLR